MLIYLILSYLILSHPIISCSILSHPISSHPIHSPCHNRESGASSAVVVTAEQKTDPHWIVGKWVLLFAHQLRRWRIGLVLARLDAGYIGTEINILISTVCVTLYVLHCVCYTVCYTVCVTLRVTLCVLCCVCYAVCHAVLCERHSSKQIIARIAPIST